MGDRRCAPGFVATLVLVLVLVIASVTVVAAPSAGAAVACPTYDDAVNRGPLVDDALEEASGVAAGRVNPNVLWTHADSGTTPRLYALDAADASTIASFDLTGTTNVDWEDIAVGRGPVDGQSYLYVGDIGGNVASPAHLVYRVPEPIIDAGAGTGPHPLAGAVALPYSYPDGAHNAETLMVDPRTGDLIIVTKALGPARVFRRPAPQSTDSVALTLVADLNFSQAPLTGWLTTGGDISPAGNEIMIRTYPSAFVWTRDWGQTIEQALAGAPCPVPLASEAQGEAVGYAADATGYFSLSERTEADVQEPLYSYACDDGLTDAPDWVGNAATWLLCSDLATGYDDHTFRPRQPITRAATARLLHRIAGTPDLTPDDTAACAPLTDVPDWAHDAICWLLGHGYATGYDDQTFRPRQPITRAATARLLHRIHV